MSFNLTDLTITDHFIDRCAERAKFLVSAKKGGGWKLNIPVLERQLYCCEQIDRPKSITRLLKYNGKTIYIAPKDKHTPKKRRMVYVIEDNNLITIYPYYGSWLDK